MEGRTSEEIGRETGRPAGTVRSLLATARRRLAREMER
jgi:DNA-directed RNA polymerase specialized sigma24 family protein